jgi:hypothetical protein
MRSRFWVILDCSMLLAVVVLQAWRLTGVILHEWLAVALIGGLLAHCSFIGRGSRRVAGASSRRAADAHA